MDVLSLLANPLIASQSPYWFVFTLLGTFLFGESIIIAAFVVAFAHPELLPGIFLAGLIGTLLADTFWYLVAMNIIRKTRFGSFLNRKNNSTVFTSLLQLAERHPYTLLLIIKFLAGMRIALTVALITRTRLPFGRFLFFDAIGAMIFIALLAFFSRFIGTGFDTIPTAHFVSKTLILIGISVLCFHILSRILLRLIENRKCHPREA